MFTGIIQSLGTVKTRELRGGDLRLRFSSEQLDLSQRELGDSIAVNGVCLTAVELSDDSFVADVSTETLSLTTLGDLQLGSSVNLEPALCAGDALGGHLVSCHVDGIGEVRSRQQDARSERFEILAPKALAAFIATKGSIAVDGTSLTVNHVEDTEQGVLFGLNIVPHTLENTIMGGYQPGTRVNLEIDLIARYLLRMQQVQQAE